MVAHSTANTAPHKCHHSGGVTSTMYCCCFKKRKRDPTKKQHVSHSSPIWACALDPAFEKRSWLPTCLLPVLLLLAGSRTTSGFPTAILALEPTLAARSTCATKEVTRWFSRWWSGSIVSIPTPQGCCGSLYTVYIQNRLSCDVAPFSFKSTKEDLIVVVSVMACHLPAWPPVGTTGASLMTSSSTVAAWFLAIVHFGATGAGQPVMGRRPCCTSQCWLSIPTWNLNLTYSWGASQSRNGGSKGQGSAAVVRCVSHPLPLPLSSCLGCIPLFIGLPFLRFHAAVSRLFLVFVFLFIYCLSRRCPLLATFLFVLFCLLYLL